MLIEYFVMKGFRRIINRDAVKEVEIATRNIAEFPSDDDILDFMAWNNLDRVEVVKSYRARE